MCVEAVRAVCWRDVNTSSGGCNWPGRRRRPGSFNPEEQRSSPSRFYGPRWREASSQIRITARWREASSQADPSHCALAVTRIRLGTRTINTFD